jgi:tRNA threonylcarbamoyl adenosine modification protein (Sua5/YciO/YrdC/YwlC family)
MAEFVDIHPITPQGVRIQSVASELQGGAVILYPSDTGFALGCNLANKSAIERIRRIRQLPESKHLTFLCDSLTHIAEYARVSNPMYKTIKRLIPGPFTFILPATKAVPRFAQDPKRKTTGIRVPDHAIALELIRCLGHPLISISAKTDDGDHVSHEVIEALQHQVDIVVTSPYYDFEGESTVIDMTTDVFTMIRAGARYEDALPYIAETD